MGYKKPLLIELLCELDLDPALSGDAVFDLAADLRSNGYPRAELSGGVVQLPGPIQPFQPRLRCWSADGKKLVQVSPTQIVVNQVGDYLGWAEFKEMFEGVLAAARQRAPISITALSLQAIDQTTFDDKSFRLGRYFVCDGTWIPKWYADCSESCDVSLGRGHVHERGQNRQLTLRVRTSAEGFMLHLVTTFKDRLRNSDVVSTLEKLHEESTAMFEAIITPETRNLMGGARI